MHTVRPARSALTRCVPVLSTSAPALPRRLFHGSASCHSEPSKPSKPSEPSEPSEPVSRYKRPERPEPADPRLRNRKGKLPFKVRDEAYQKELDDGKKLFPKLTEEQLETMRKRYTPEQMEAIEAGEKAIHEKDLYESGKLRVDPYVPPYLDDFATIQPVIDAKPQKPVKPREVQWLPRKEWVDDYVEKMADRVEVQLKDTMGKAYARALRKIKQTDPESLDFTEEELKALEENPELRKKFLVDEDVDVLGKASTKKAEKAISEQWLENVDKKFYEELEAALSTDTNPLEPSRLDTWKAIEGEEGDSALAPKLGKIEGVEGLYNPEEDSEDRLDPTGEFAKIKAVTGMQISDIQTLLTKAIVHRNVHNQTRLGKIRSTSIIVVAGNGNGRLGIGEAKSTDASIARVTARMLAIRNMKPVRRYENRTIFGQVQKKISGTVVKLEARPPGFGLRVSHRIFEMARLAGIHDLSAKIMRSKNPYNTVKVVYECLMNQPDPEEIAMGRGKKLVDVRKVYYGGSVY